MIDCNDVTVAPPEAFAYEDDITAEALQQLRDETAQAVAARLRSRVPIDPAVLAEFERYVREGE